MSWKSPFAGLHRLSGIFASPRGRDDVETKAQDQPTSLLGPCDPPPSTSKRSRKLRKDMEWKQKKHRNCNKHSQTLNRQLLFTKKNKKKPSYSSMTTTAMTKVGITKAPRTKMLKVKSHVRPELIFTSGSCKPPAPGRLTSDGKRELWGRARWSTWKESTLASKSNHFGVLIHRSHTLFLVLHYRFFPTFDELFGCLAGGHCYYTFPNALCWHRIRLGSGHLDIRGSRRWPWNSCRARSCSRGHRCFGLAVALHKTPAKSEKP